MPAGGAEASVFLGAIVVLIPLEIGLRSGFHASTLIADEYGAYFFVAAVMLGLPIAPRDGAHIRIAPLSGPLPEAGERWLDILVHLRALALCLLAFRGRLRLQGRDRLRRGKDHPGRAVPPGLRSGAGPGLPWPLRAPWASRYRPV